VNIHAGLLRRSHSGPVWVEKRSLFLAFCAEQQGKIAALHVPD
jgi:hypothetical protein